VSREIKAILADMRLKPAPTIIDVDIRDDAEVLKPIISRITSSPDLPVLLIGGKNVGSIDDIRALHQSGELRKLITASGAIIDGAKKKKHRKRT
jgi:glutaredoxin